MPKRINLYGTIVASDDAWLYEWFEMDHTTPRMISDQLAQADGDDVELYINSPGGDVWAGSEIYTALREYSGNVTAKVVSIAASAASVAMCGAKSVMISPTAQIMVHRSSTGAWGNKNTFDQTSQMLNSVDEGMVNAYEHKTGKSREELLALMDVETFLNAQQALENGFADEIMFAQTEKVAASAAAPLFSSEVMNKIKSKLIRENMFPGAPTASMEPEKPASIKAVTENKEETKIMDKNELEEKHPDLYAQITSEAKAAERERVTALQAYAKAPGAEQFVIEAIANGGTVQDVALKVMEASMKRASQEATNRALDAEDSKVDDVAAIEAKTPDAVKEEQKVNAAANMIAMAQKMKSKNGGRK
ncbi:ATP-dependent Clp endopeptidase proteolytic subunit ClpP [Paenibacillus rhizosphaerae]|uniref:ATP-dependent Clp protease proteolytic subunit n=1 Tax=Paenibacillus rhizosphaerae TaxID=297318 RepID=A0A839U036_9BACL|nr:head maturation protease, ClpP-related [Paenibacillus rhizosphaerae]MBB3132113.1 ATP-dependent Clp endopeptidase proteolytic subunit ClpP [Paenibacillus rhizosphaerae]